MPESFYQQLGGETPLRQLVDRFYQLMDELPEAREVRDLHPPQLEEAADKLYMFLSGWTGGPPLYIEAYGHPRLRRRHLHVKIGKRERDQWMLCMDLAMHDCKVPEQLHQDLYQALYNNADFLRNHAEDEAELVEDGGSGLSRLRINSAAPKA